MEGEKFMVMIDLATHYCRGSWIRNKIPKKIIKTIIERWIGIFGAPKKILSDNGLEFQNEEVRRMKERFGIEMLSTAADRP